LILVEDAEEEIDVGFGDGFIEADADGLVVDETEVDVMWGGELCEISGGEGKLDVKCIEERFGLDGAI
jgi:hypothetical protein